MQAKRIKHFIFCCFLFTTNIVFAQEPKLVLPIGHTKSVNYVQFSPDGKKIVTFSNDKTVKIWDVITGSILADLTGHTNYITVGKFSPDGKKVATASDDSTAKIWDAVTGKLLIDLKGHKGYISTVQFSPDGKKVVTASGDTTVKIWDATTGKLLLDLKEHFAQVNNVQFSPDGTKVVTASEDKVAMIWDAATGKLLKELIGHKSPVHSAMFSPDGTKIITASYDRTAKVWNAVTGMLLFDLKGHTEDVNAAEFSPDGKMIITASADKIGKVWDAATGRLLVDLKGHTGNIVAAQFSPDSKKIITAAWDFTAKEWDAVTGKLLDTLVHDNIVNYVQYSPDGKKIVTASSDRSAVIWTSGSNKPPVDLLGHSSYIGSIQISSDGNEIITSSEDGVVRTWDAISGNLLNALRVPKAAYVNYTAYGPVEISDSGFASSMFITALSDSTAKIWDNNTGEILTTLKGHKGDLTSARFNAAGTKVVTASYDKTAKIWGPNSSKWLVDLRGHAAEVLYAEFSPDGKKVVTASADGTARIWSTLTGKMLVQFKQNDYINTAAFSPNGKNIVTACHNRMAVIWDAVTGKQVMQLKGHTDYVLSATYSPDGKQILTSSWDNTSKIWDAATGQLLFILKGHEGDVTDGEFTPDGKRVITSSSDNTCKVWNAQTGELLYTFMAIDFNDYLIVDKANHYDGSQAALKLLYFNYQGEVIELSQLKDQLWIPGLAERINRGEEIHAKTLTELNVFNFTPQVEDVSTTSDEYRFNISPRKGGIGETVVFVNGIEAKRYKAGELKNNAGVYELVINKNDLKDFFIAGKENPVSVKAYTNDNSIASRGVVIKVDKTKENITPPNLYAVMIGVSDYKGDELDLKYAAKDATDISGAIGSTAKKLLNTDDKDHVFMYNLTTNKERYQLPEKKAIQKLLEDIGKKTTANDVLLIFFAGHGVMAGEADKEQFYFLTADASTLSSTDAVKEVGISTSELTDWINPQNIKAQKRILIFDACNSGQAIKDFVKLGNDNQNFVAARNDDKSQQVKAIDKLNEKSGLFILSASASDQSAYEMGRYSQGLLTYSLLKAIKQQPDILEDGKYLDISRWFNAAEKTVTEISKESGARQDPQIVTNTNFNIGIVDQEVMSQIVLPQEKPLFSGSNFQNAAEEIAADDLGLNKLIDQQLNELSARGANAAITYVAGSASPDAYTLSGRYTVTGNNISIKIFIRQKNEVKQKIDLAGTKDNLKELAVLIASKTEAWASGKK
ncbi:beta-propeller domain-containing protein [Ferruginibacter sp.]|nr:caspase family protein [Ferruginibacter sp.]